MLPEEVDIMFLLLHTFSEAVSNVVGNIPGNNLMKTGNSNSMKGTIMNTENGTNLNKSDVVRTS